MLDDAGVHAVVEPAAAVLEVVLEVDVAGALAGPATTSRAQVMGGEQADRAAVREPLGSLACSASAVVGVRAAEQLVERNSSGDGAARGGAIRRHGDLGVETGSTPPESESCTRSITPTASGGGYSRRADRARPGPSPPPRDQ